VKKLIFLFTMIVLATSGYVLAGNDLETVANFEEGSSYYDMNYGAKIIAGAQGTQNIYAEGKYKPGYTEQELKNIELAAVDTAGGSVTASMGGMQRAFGEAMLGSGINSVPTEAITALPSLPWEYYVSTHYPQLTPEMYAQRVANVPNVMIAANPMYRQTSLDQFNTVVMNAQAEAMNRGYNIGDFVNYRLLCQYAPTQYWSWPGMPTTPYSGVITDTYSSYLSGWQNVHDSFVAQIPQPTLLDQMPYYEWLRQQDEAHKQQDAQAFRQTHPMDSARNY